MELRLIGETLDSLGVKAPLRDNEQVTQAMVIMKVVDFETGTTSLTVAHNGLDWIEKQGLIGAAHMALGTDLEEVPQEEDDDL